jgi:peptidoglycan/xylan/chitin deacetylase (PgdA/CDA1 family)
MIKLIKKFLILQIVLGLFFLILLGGTIFLIKNYFTPLPQLSSYSQEQIKKPDNIPSLKAKVPILAYHHIKKTKPEDNQTEKILSISPEVFEQQMKVLKALGYQPIWLKDLYKALFYGEKLPERPIVITFDDGYKDNFQNAFPILKKYNFKATFFVIPQKVGSSGYMSWEELEIMRDSGMEIQSHTFSHSHLNELKGDFAFKELSESKKAIETKLNIPVYFISWPYDIYNEELIMLAQKAGYLGGVSLHYGLWQAPDNIFEMFRVEIRGDKDYRLYRFLAKIWGFNYK